MSAVRKLFHGFKVWSKEGKFYKKEGLFGRKQEMTVKETEEYLKNNTITQAHFEMNDKFKIGDHFANMQAEYVKMRDNGVSPHGERVNVIPLEVSQERTDEGINLKGRWRVETESGKFIHDISMDLEGFHGNFAENICPDFAEFFKNLNQLYYSGASATEEDVNRYWDSTGMRDRMKSEEEEQ